MSDDTPITIAVAGSGSTTADNLADLLNDFLGFGEEDADGFYGASDREITLILPAGDAWSNKELHKVVEWSAKADLPYLVILEDGATEKGFVKKTLADADGADIKGVPAGTVGQALLEALADEMANDVETYLVLLYGDDEDGPGEVIEDLLEAALDQGIPVKDLTEGLDDIKFAEEDPTDVARGLHDDPEPEPEPEPEKPARRRGRAKAEEQAVAEEPLEEPAKVSADEARAAAKRAKEEGEARKAEVLAKTNANLTEDLPHDRHSQTSLQAGYVSILAEDLTSILEVVKYATAYFGAEDTTNAAVNLAPEVQYRPLTRALAEVQENLGAILSQETPSEAAGSTETAEKAPEVPQEPEAAAAPRKSRGRPRADGTPAQPKDPNEPTITVFEDEDGNLTKAGRGRPPKGQKRTKITEAQAREEGLIE